VCGFISQTVGRGVEVQSASACACIRAWLTLVGWPRWAKGGVTPIPQPGRTPSSRPTSFGTLWSLSLRLTDVPSQCTRSSWRCHLAQPVAHLVPFTRSCYWHEGIVRECLLLSNSVGQDESRRLLGKIINRVKTYPRPASVTSLQFGKMGRGRLNNNFVKIKTFCSK
jgi:hypothetical protein